MVVVPDGFTCGGGAFAAGSGGVGEVRGGIVEHVLCGRGEYVLDREV